MGWGENANSRCQLGGEPGTSWLRCARRRFFQAGQRAGEDTRPEHTVRQGSLRRCCSQRSGPGPVATGSAADSLRAGRELRPPDPWPGTSWEPGNVLGRLPGRESFVQLYSHLQTLY